MASSSLTLSVMAASSPPGAAQRKRRGINTSPDAEIVALSPKTLLATYRFWCDVCEKGFTREQNLQLHRRGHNLPGKLKQKTSHGIRKKVYICPEMGCVHHDPSRALGDLTGIKKHFSRKHCERKFSCQNCNKKYAVQSDWKAHNKICGNKNYTCECGTTFPRRESFTYHRSICDVLTEKVARHTTNRSPYSSMTAGIPANASNPGSMCLAPVADSVIPGSHNQLTTPLLGQGASSPYSFTSLLSGKSIESAFQPIHPPSVPLHPGAEPKLSFPRPSDFSGINGFQSYTVTSNMFGVADLNNPHNDLVQKTNNLFSGLMTNTSLMKSKGNSSSGEMKFNSYTGALGDGMSSAGGIGGGRTFVELKNNRNVGGGSYGSAGGYGGGMEPLRDQMNAPYGGLMFNVNNADGMLVGHVVNNNVLGDSQMNVQSEYRDTITRDFLGIGLGMNSLGGGGMGGDDHNGNRTTNSWDREATTSAEARPFVHHLRPGFSSHPC